MGIDLYSSAHRALTAGCKRWDKAMLRNKKVIKLRFSKVRKRLFATAVHPQMTYGAPVHGLPPSALARARSRLAGHLGAKAGWCTTTIIQLECPGIDPAVRVKTDIVKGHMDTWLKLHELRLPIKRAWAVTKKKLLSHPPNQRWRHVHGPLAATIATMLDEGWQPQEPGRWTDGQGST